MENNFFVGIVNHSKKIGRESCKEKTVLYREDDSVYVDLVKNISYTTDSSQKDYVEEETLLPTDISDYRTDFEYLLLRYNSSGKNVKKKKKKPFQVFK